MKRKRPRNTSYRFFQWVVRLFVVLLLSGLALSLLGVPGSWVSLFLNQGDRMPGRVELSRIMWQPGHGWVAEEFQWYSPRDLTRPLLTAPSLRFTIARGDTPNWIQVSGGDLKTDIGVWTRDLTTRQPVHVSNFSGQIGWTDERVILSELLFQISGIDIRIDGEVSREEVSSVPLPATDPSVMFRRVLHPLVPVLEGLNSFTSDHPPLLHVEVSGAMSSPEARIFTSHQEPFELRGSSFTGFQFFGDVRNRVLTVKQLDVMAGDAQSLRGSANVNFPERTFFVQLQNTLSRDALEALSPFSLDAFLSSLALRVEGAPEFDLTIGPSPFSKPGQRLAGSFQIKNGSYRDAFFPRAIFELDLENSHLKIEEFSGILGSDEQAGPVAGRLELDWVKGLFRLSVEGSAYPDLVVSLVGPQVESLLREWEFQGAPPEFKLEVDRLSREVPMELYLITKAQSAVWRGTLFDQIRALTTLDRKGLRIRELLARRGDYQAEGSFTFPRDFQSCTYTLESSFPLPDVLPLLGQQAMDIIRPIRFLGPTRFSSSGVVDLSGEHRHRLSGQAYLEDMVINWVAFDILQSTFALEGQQLELPDIQGELVEGDFSAEVRLVDLFEPTATVDARLSVQDVDLFKLITKATDQPTTPYTGTLFLDLNLAGSLRDSIEVRRASTFQGGGSVQIREGELFRIPLLLGLSNILGKVIKGFGYASQGDFDADFVIENGRVSSRNVLLGGSVMSIAGNAAYELDTRKIDGNLKVQLLKDGFMSDTLKVLLWPIRKLIEVSLTGTLDNPDWRPRNLPKEIFGK